MKSILVIFLMFSVMSGFAKDNGKEYEVKSKTSPLEIKQNGITYEKNSLEYGYTATCSVTIRNTQTGETRTIFSSGTGSTPSAARSSCASNARATAYMVAAILND